MRKIYIIGVVFLTLTLNSCGSSWDSIKYNHALNTVANTTELVVCVLTGCPVGRHSHFDRYGRSYGNNFYRRAYRRTRAPLYVTYQHHRYTSQYDGKTYCHPNCNAQGYAHFYESFNQQAYRASHYHYYWKYGKKYSYSCTQYHGY